MKTSSTRRPLQKQAPDKTEKPFFGPAKEKNEQKDGTFFQAKSIDGTQYSAMEKEADHVASRVTRSLQSSASSSQRMGQMGIQKKDAEEDKQVQQKAEDEKKEEGPVQKKSEDDKKDEAPVQKKSEDDKKDENPVQKKSEDEKTEEKPVQKKEDKPSTVKPEAKFDSLLNKTKGGGSVLPAKVKSQLEQQMNANFEHVRIHSGQDAIELCSISKAQAFTHGNDIYFNTNKFNPDNAEGLSLLAHELTHVVQQKRTDEIIRMTPDTHQLDLYLNFLSDCFTARLKAVFDDKKMNLPALPKPRNAGAISELIASHKLSYNEVVILMLALAPHLYGNFFDKIIQPFIHESGDFSQLGGVRSTTGRNFLPTGETAAFILASDDLKNRLAITAIFNHQHAFATHNILHLQEVEPGDPVLNGKIILSEELTEWLTTGTRSIPKISMRFPAQHLETNLEWSDVILSSATLNQIQELEEWVKHHQVLMNDWGMQKHVKSGYKVLFHGPPGTGKTLTASLLGKYTGKPVFRIDLSMIVSKFIGETEKNLSQLFAKAENKNWILFFDEADALFGKRTNVKDAHDKYANQEASYLLQRIEQYSGLVILATNFKNNIDEAFMRRFQSIIFFPLPNAEERLQLWKRAFPEKANISTINIEQLAKKYELSGSAIFNVVQFACLKTLAQNLQEVSSDIILKGIQREYAKENRIW